MKEIFYNGKPYTLKKIPIKNWTIFIEELQKVEKDFKILIKQPWYKKIFKTVSSKIYNGEMGEYGEIYEKIVYSLKNYPSKITHLLFIATQIPEEELIEGSLEDLVGLAEQVWEVNNLINIFKDNLKKVLAQRQMIV